MFHFFLKALLAACLLPYLLVNAVTGVDVSQRTYESSFSCWKGYGYNFAIIRVYCSNGSPDSNGPANINDAWKAGMAHVDGYIFPCYSCGNPAGQIDATISYLASHSVRVLKQNETRESLETQNGKDVVGATVGMLWLDIEGFDYWSSTPSNNVNFISSMLTEGSKKGYSMGIYSSSYYWNPITGSSTAFKSYPLWYAHWDSNPSFSDYSAFGGWSKPAIKQYVGDDYFCSAGVDKNYYP